MKICKRFRLSVKTLLVAAAMGYGLAQGAVTNVVLTATNVLAGETLPAINGDLLILTEAVTNDGTLCASNNGVMHVYGPTLNRGTIEAVDGVIRFYGEIVNQGTLVGTNIFRVCSVPQLYFQNDAGMVARWTLDRFGMFQYAQVLGHTHEWRLMAAADIDGDGIDDLVWQTPDHRVGIWFMDENFVQRDARFYWNTGDWEVRTCSSRTAGWRAALFFQRPDGTAAAWDLAADGNFLSADVLGNQQSWRLRAAAPRQRGVLPDLLWQRPDGGVSAWRWANGSGVQPQWLASAGDWVLRGSVDIDGDGTADLIWQTPDQRVGGWLMDSNSAPREAHFWWQTRGWHLRAAGIGRLVYPLHPPTPPDTNNTIQVANQWLATGGTLQLTGNGGGSQMTNLIIAAGTLVVTQNWGTAFVGFTNLLNRVLIPPTNNSPGGSSATVPVLFTNYTVNGGVVICGGSGTLTPTVGTLILTNGTLALAGTNLYGGGLQLSNTVLSVGGSLIQTGSGTLILTGTNLLAGGTLLLGSSSLSNLTGCTVHIGTNSYEMGNLLAGGNGVVTWLGSGARLYTNNVLVTSVTLQLETNALTGAISGTLNPGTDAVALGALTLSNLFTSGASTFSIASPITFPGIIYTNGVLQLQSGSPTDSAPLP